MNNNNDLSFSELRSKEVINSVDGKRLGRIIDIVFSGDSGKIKGVVVPFNRKCLFFKSNQDIYIPWNCVTKIGEDVIIVVLNLSGKHGRGCDLDVRDHHQGQGCDRTACDSSNDSGGYSQPHCDKPNSVKPKHKCDRRCEKCMLFDCENRWKSDKDDIIITNNDKY